MNTENKGVVETTPLTNETWQERLYQEGIEIGNLANFDSINKGHFLLKGSDAYIIKSKNKDSLTVEKINRYQMQYDKNSFNIAGFYHLYPVENESEEEFKLHLKNLNTLLQFEISDRDQK